MEATDHKEKWLDSVSQKLQDYEEILPPNSWERMEARLSGAMQPAVQRRQWNVKQWLSVAATLLVAVSSIYLFMKKQEAVSNLGSSMQTSVIALTEQSSLSLPSNATSLFCEGGACYYLDRNLVERARIYAVSEEGIALFTAKRDGFELSGQNGLDSALQASLLQTLTDHRQLFLQSLAAIFLHPETSK